MNLKLNEEIVISQSNDECIIYSIDEEKIYKLNSSAKFITSFLKEHKVSTKENLLRSASDYFNNFDSTVMDKFISELLELTILVKSE
jgi:hypothetical protein